MRNIAICDDEPLYRERLAQSVRAHGNGQAAQLQLFDSPAALLQAVHMHGYAPDIAVLDIQMDEMTGIELAKQLNAALPQCAIIFVSSFLGFATDVYEAEHTYFILKSELEQRIGTALQRALNRKVPPVLHYPVTQGYRSVSCAQVLCLERILRRTKLTLLGGITEWTALPPAELLDAEAAQQFIRCHQSYWVNLSRVRCIRDGAFVMESGGCVPISRTYQHPAREAFFRSLVDGEK